MNVRLVAATSLALVAGVSPVAGNAAPPKKACNLVVDAAGDATGFVFAAPGLAWPTNRDVLDVTGADIATNAKNAVGVIRVKKLSTDPEITSPGGIGWILRFQVGPTDVYFRVLHTVAAKTYEVGWYDATTNFYKQLTPLPANAVVFDTAKNEIQITAPVLAFVTKAKLAPGGRATKIQAMSYRYMNPTANTGVMADYAGQFGGVDEQKGQQPYTFGGASCVSVPR